MSEGDPDQRRAVRQRLPARTPARPARAESSATAEPGAASPAARVWLQLQGAAGNAAVSGLLAGQRSAKALQRLANGGAIPPPPVAPGPALPAEHPGFRATKAKVTAAKRSVAKHPSPRSKAAEAAKAAKPPADDKESQAKAAKAGEMGAAPVGSFDKAAFIAAVSAAIAKHAPKNLEESDKAADAGPSEVAAEVKGKVSQGKDTSAKPMEEASAKAPDQSKATEKQVTPLAPPPAPGAAPPIDAAAAMPAKAPAEQTELGAGKGETNQKMADAEVTEGQLVASNEPEFIGAVAAKKEGEQHSATAPATFRESEAQKLAAAQQGAQASGVQGTAGMVAARGAALQQVGGSQQKAQTKDESKRADVTGKIKSIFDTTKAAVDLILNGIDPQVNEQFTQGEGRAKAAFTAHHKARMEKYKDDRYSGVLGAGRWIRDKFADLPGEVNQFYVEAKQIYENQMKAVISDIADLVGRELTKAKERVTQGRKEISTYVGSLEPSLRSFGSQAAQEIGTQFDSLEQSVDEKSQSLAEDLAEKYVTARTAVDDEIKTMQEENKGLWSKAKDAVGGAIETILKLKDMLLGVLARAAGAVSKIIKDPIGFLGKFVTAVKTGVMNFGANILEHLKKGLQSWLLGSLAEAGIELPEKFDLKGIVTLVLSLLGLTWASIRARLAKVLPDWVLKALETSVEVVKILTTEGVSGLWKFIVDKIVDLKDQVLGQVKDFVITKIITAGITWLISLLNPAAAFIKACKMIYDAVMWFVDNAERMKDFVDSVLDSVESIASGGVGKVAALIEATLGKAIPMVISGLASLLGLGGISDKIKKILETVQKPVGKVVNGIIGGVVKFGKKMLGKLKSKKVTDKAGKAGNDSARSADVRTGATRDLNQKLSHRTNAAHIRSIATGVFNTWHPRGLKGLEVVSHGPQSKKFDLYITASPKLKAGEVECALEVDPRESGADHSQDAQNFKAPDDMRLEDKTATRAQINLSWPQSEKVLGMVQSGTVRSGGRFWFHYPGDTDAKWWTRRTLDRRLDALKQSRDSKGEGAHAEQVAVAAVKTALPSAANFRATFDYAPICWLKLSSTRSPCGRICAPAIVDLMDFAKSKDWEMKVSVTALSLYTAKGDTSDGKAGLALLASRGVSLSVTQLSEKQQQTLLEKDPQLAGTIGRRGIELQEEIIRAKAEAEIKLGQSG